MTFIQPYLWRPIVLCGLALALGACGTTYGTGVNPGAQTVKDLTGMLSFGAGKNSAPIDYEARPPIVTPPNIASLPAPGSGTTVQNWPNDPDVKARDQQIANANKKTVDTGTALVDPGFRLPKQKVVPYEEETVDEQVLSLFQQQEGKAEAHGDGQGRRRRPGRRQRQPDSHRAHRAARRVPGAGSVRPRGIRGGVQARTVHLGKKKDAPRPSEMGGGTDDIADPVANPTGE